MNKFDEHAAALQRMNRESEHVKLQKFDGEAVKRSIVYTREDVTMLVSYMSSLNKQVASLRRVLWVLVALGVIGILQRL